MKQLILPALLCGIALFSCKNDPKTDISNVSANTPPRADTLPVQQTPNSFGASVFTITEGLVYWSGRQAVGQTHTGTIQVSGGELLVKEGQLLRGKITLDMRSIGVTNMKDPGEKDVLESHLKDVDFFDTQKFPAAEFTIDEVMPSNLQAFNSVIRGDLTLKGKSNAVNIPVKLNISNDELSAESPSFVINRTQWGINFRSGILSTAKDKLIDDVIPLSFKVKARKTGKLSD